MNGDILDRCVSLLAEKHKTAKGLCDYVGIPQNTFSTWKKRHTDPSPKYIPSIAEYLEVQASYLLTGESETPTPGINQIPVYAILPANLSPQIHTTVQAWEPIPAEWVQEATRYIGLQIHDNSMYPWYLNGDTVIVRLQTDCQSNQEAVIFLADTCETLVRRVVKVSDGILLQPLNPNLPAQFYHNTAADKTLKILGVVMELRRRTTQISEKN